ncbi:MAG: N-acetylmuramoyl-L-alanine amidase, partial [Prevotellaceae bacterium]|nr:N-acetylmuramoyl-L-alanine amidase [Prevotellaceae bacterium]
MKKKFLTYFANKIPYIVCCLTFFCISIIFANAQNYVSQQQIKKIVIDAGHGGKDPGARGKKINEKDITLSVALKFGEFIKKSFPEIEVIYTRNKDVFIELNERTNIANRNNADLFISFHVNAFTTSTPRGVSTWIMGTHKSQANLEVSRRENAVITMEDDYSSKYQGFDPTSPESYIIFSLMQYAHRNESFTLAEFVQKELLQTSPLKIDKGVQQAGFLVLWKTAMPSILIELGFISNPNDEQILADVENQTKIAKSVFSAFSKYKQQYEKYNNSSDTQPSETVKPEKTEEKPVAETKNNSDSIKEKTEEKPVAETKNNLDSVKEKTEEKPVAETKNNLDSVKEKTEEKIS